MANVSLWYKGGQKQNRAYRHAYLERKRLGVDSQAMNYYIRRIQLAMLRHDWLTATNIINDHRDFICELREEFDRSKC